VRSRMFQGESQLIVVQIGAHVLTFRLPTHVDNDKHLPEPGQQAMLSLHPEHAFVVPSGPAN